MTSIAAAVAALTLAGVPAKADLATEARAVEESFKKAVESGDVDGVLGCETADHDHIGILGRVAGKPALKNLLTEQWKSVTNRSLEIIDQETIPLGKDSLVSLTHWKYAFSTPDGKRQEFKLRMTRVMKREDGKLRITTEHVSIGIPPPPSGK